MTLDTLDELRHDLIVHDHEDAWEKLLYEMQFDESGFVCCEVCYEQDDRIYYLSVYTNKRVYATAEIDNSIIWTCANRNPNGAI